ncbi:MAG: RidA family protein, partial [Rubritepida sp.]|nr:RidA family protein [Rubritepida sp.]
MSADARLAALGIVLPPAPKPMGNYVAWRIGGGLLFLSGVGPRQPDGSFMAGVLGADLTVAQGYEAARLCAINLLANMKDALGSLDRVETILKVLGMVRAIPEFGQQPEV